jgi:hypothetical protein
MSAKHTSPQEKAPYCTATTAMGEMARSWIGWSGRIAIAIVGVVSALALMGRPSREPPPVPALVAKADDLDAIRSTVVDAASVSGGLWLSYLFVLFYLLVAVGAVTHRDLFLENQIKLPFLDVELPLKGFFWLGPLLFLIVHSYVLLHFVLLSSKTGVFDTQLQAEIHDDAARVQLLRRQLPINIFVQFLAGPVEVRHGVVGSLLRLIAWISLVIGPVALLVFFELQFLPYHSVYITVLQRIAVILDLVLLWLLWPAIRHGDATRRGWWNIGGTTAILIAVSLLSVVVVCAIATFRGEWLETKLAWLPLRQWLIARQVDGIARKPESPLSNRLVLPGLDVIDHVRFDTEPKIAAAPEMASLRGRHLEDAVLIKAILKKVDFTGAYLSGANLSLGDLSGAILARAFLDCANLAGANLSGADLRSADLTDADLTDADLTDANLGNGRSGPAPSSSPVEPSEVHNLTQTQLNLACGKPKALPPGLILNKACPKALPPGLTPKKACPKE